MGGVVCRINLDIIVMALLLGLDSTFLAAIAVVLYVAASTTKPSENLDLYQNHTQIWASAPCFV